MITAIRWIILCLLFWGFPTFCLYYINDTLGAITSLITVFLPVVYFILKPKTEVIKLNPVLFLGVLYYCLSAFNYFDNEDIAWINSFIKFLIVACFFPFVVKDTKLNELFVIIVLGCLSIIVHSVFFPKIDAHFGSTYGRFSGFYLNPNYASLMCIIGISISFGVKNLPLKLIGQIILSVGGLMTLSRTFLALFVAFNLLAIIKSKKNLMLPILGTCALLLILAFGESSLNLNTKRFEALSSVFDNNTEIKMNTIKADSRNETWALYYDLIYSRPLLGHGYKSFQGGYFGILAGVHNTFLMVIGESGILCFLLLVINVTWMFFKSIRNYNSEMEILFLNISFIASLMFGHTFFEKYSNLFLMLLLWYHFTDKTYQFK